MNVFGHFKKIFNSFDFMGNRIKRLRVDTPEKFIDDKHPEIPANPQYREDLEGHTPDEVSHIVGKDNDKYNEIDYERYKDFVANKDYVDKRTTYKSERAYNMESASDENISSNIEPDKAETLAGIPGPEKITIYENGSDIVKEVPKRTPSQFPWMTNVFGKPHEEVLDELLYPRIPYKYENPVITNINFRTDELLVECLESNSKTNKFTIMQNMANNLFVEIYIKNGDWFNAKDAKLVFIHDDDSITTLNLISGITHVVSIINDLYEPVIIKDNLVRVEFHQTYDDFQLHYDTWGYPTYPDNSSAATHKMIVDVTDEFFKQCYCWNLKTKGHKPEDTYINSFNKVTINTTDIIDESVKLIKVTNPIDDDYYLECFIYRNTDDEHKDQLINTTIINQDEIKPDGTIAYNFGVYPYNIYLKFRPVPVTTKTKFEQKDIV